MKVIKTMMQPKVTKLKKPSKTVKDSHQEDFDVQSWSDREVNELVSSYVTQQYIEKDFYD